MISVGFPLSQLRASTELFLEASYYNIRTDSWEPILEPIVDPRNESQYVSWGMKGKVVRSLPHHLHTKGMYVACTLCVYVFVCMWICCTCICECSISYICICYASQ